MRLHVLTGPSKGATAEIAGERFVVGRDDACDLVLRDGSVARRHAAFERVSGQTYVLRDLGSAEGTFVRGQRIDGPVALLGNERLTFGSVTAQLVLTSKPRGRRRSRRARWAVPAIVAAVFLIAAAVVAAVLATRGDGTEPSFFDAVTVTPPATEDAPASTAPATSPGAAAEEEEGGSQAAAETTPAAPAAPPEGPGVIAYAHDEEAAREVRLMNPDGMGQGRLVRGDDPAVSPDGERVVVVGSTGGLSLVPTAGGKAAVVSQGTASGGRALDPDWSPDGTRLVLGDSNGGVEIVNADGSEPRSLGSGPAESPSWSPDGTAIALAARVSADSTVVGTVGVDGSEPSPLTTVEPLSRSGPAGVDWSPDGTRLALTCVTKDPDGKVRPDVCVMDAAGGEVTAIAGGAASDADPVWSPDGSRIAFVSDRDGNEEIYVMDADGGGQRRLTFDPAPDRAPSWGPGGEVARPLAPVVFVDDFSSPDTGWEVFKDNQGASSQYAAGGLRLRMPDPGFVVTSDSGRGWEGGVTVRVDAASTGAATNAAFGVVCQYRDQRNLTLLGVTADGGFGITRWVDGNEQVLVSGGPELGSGNVPVGASLYRLEADCAPRRLSLAVDGRVVAETRGNGSGGSVGLFVRTLDRGGADVRFDDVVVARD
jgi:Tol biopolymer transport system component